MFEKSYPEKRKNVVYPGLRYAAKKLKFACKIFFLWKCLFEYEIRFAVEKRNIKTFGANSILQRKIFVVAIKKMLAIQLSYMEIIW